MAARRGSVKTTHSSQALCTHKNTHTDVSVLIEKTGKRFVSQKTTLGSVQDVFWKVIQV